MLPRRFRERRRDRFGSTADGGTEMGVGGAVSVGDAGFEEGENGPCRAGHAADFAGYECRAAVTPVLDEAPGEDEGTGYR